MAETSTFGKVRPFILPSFTALLGLTGLATGALGLSKPQDAIKIFGLTPPPTSPSSHVQAFQNSVIRTYAIRNIGNSVSLLALTTWALTAENESTRVMVRRIMGLTVAFGTIVGLGDALIIRDFGATKGVEGKEEAEAGALGHGITALMILGVGLGLVYDW